MFIVESEGMGSLKKTLVKPEGIIIFKCCITRHNASFKSVIENAPCYLFLEFRFL